MPFAFGKINLKKKKENAVLSWGIFVNRALAFDCRSMSDAALKSTQVDSAPVSVSAVTPRSGGGGATGNPWSPCSLNAAAAAAAAAAGVGVPGSQHGVPSHHTSLGQHAGSHAGLGAGGGHGQSGQHSPQSQSSAHTFYPWMAIAGQCHSSSFFFVFFSKNISHLLQKVNIIRVYHRWYFETSYSRGSQRSGPWPPEPVV